MKNMKNMNTNNTNEKRAGKRWTISEIIKLQREYELLELNIQEIAFRHQRSVESILFKLQIEGFIENWNSARGIDEFNNSKKNDTSVEVYNQEYCDVSDVDKLSERVWNLETSVSDIKGMVKNMFDKLVQENNKKSSLRKINTLNR